MDVHVGTSGYSYKEWKGSFYPPDQKANGMLAYYASKFRTVEINNTFYRMPTRKVLSQWSGEVPDAFRFVLKAPQRITHQQRLKGSEETTAMFFDIATELGGKIGAFLFQLPPFLKKDAAALQTFVAALPRTLKVAFEFRHASWDDDEIYGVLRANGVAMCLAESDEAMVDDLSKPIVPTADWGYLRLRRTDYLDADLEAWATRLRAQPWREAYVFLKHEDEGKGPRFAMRLREILSA